MSAGTLAPESPYKGLRPFEATDVDARLFFGRERERELIAANLTAARLTVLYGESGVGKSSVLRAGVAHSLRQDAREGAGFAVALYSTWSDENPIEGIAEAVREAVEDVLGPDPGPGAGTLAERLQAWSELVAGEIYLVLDQVDEYFLYHGADGGPLLDELPLLVTEPGLPVNVLLGIREDSLARLDVFKARIPSLFGNYLRLERLAREAARAAIVGPLQQWSRMAGEESVTIEPALVDTILDEVAVGRIGGNGSTPRWQSRTVEPPYLQIVLERIWDAEREAGSPVLRLETLEQLGGARRVVSEHLDRALDELSDDERDTAAAMFGHLVTPSGAKVAHDVADLAGYAAVDEPAARRVADVLMEERILRPVEDPRGDGARVEIFHDVLAGAVAEWRRQHQAERLVVDERAKAARRHRRLLVVAVFALVALAAMTAVAVYAIAQQQEANDQRRQARARELAAQALVRLPTDPVGALSLALRAASEEESQGIEEILRTVILGVSQTASYGDGGTPINAGATMEGRVVTGDARGRVVVYRPDGSIEAEFKHASPISAIAVFDNTFYGESVFGEVRPIDTRFSDTRLVTGSRDGETRIWRLSPKGRCCRLVRALPGPPPVAAVAFASASTLILARGHTISAWSANGDPQWRRTLPIRAHEISLGSGLGVVVSGNHRAFVVGSGPGHPLTSFGGRDVTSAVGYVDTDAAGRLRELVATGHDDHLVRTWNAKNGKADKELAGHRESVTDVEVSNTFPPLLMSASADGTARAWNPIKGELVGILTGHTNQVRAVSTQSRSGDVLTVSTDRTVRVWKPHGQFLASLVGHREAIRGASFNALRPEDYAADSVLTWSEDGTARTWDYEPDPRLVPVASPRHTLSMHVARAFLADASPMPRGVLIDPFGTSLMMWPRQPDESPFAGIPGTRGDVVAADMNSDGSIVVAAERNRALLTDLRSGRPLRRFDHGSPVSAVALAPDGTLIATGGREGEIRLWNRDEAQSVSEISTGLGTLTATAIDASGSRIAVGDAAGRAGLWDIKSGDQISTLSGHHDRITGLEFSPDGKLVVTTSRDHQARLWRTDTGMLDHVLGHFFIVSGAGFSPDGRWVVTAGGQRAVVWDVRTGETVLKLTNPDPEGGRFHDVAFSLNGRWIYAVDQSSVGRYRCLVCGTIRDLKGVAESRLRRLTRRH